MASNLGLVVLLVCLLPLAFAAGKPRNARFQTSISVETDNPSNSPNDVANIAAWNIFKFGSSDASDSDILDTIVEVMSVYDVVYVQEIDDEGAADDLLDALQDDSGSSDWRMEITPFFGTYYQAYYWKNSRVTLESFFLFGRTFSRSGSDSDFGNGSPFCAKFRPADEDDDDNAFGVIGTHVATGSIDDELDLLPDAYRTAQEHFNVDGFVLLGDYNADQDCRDGFRSVCFTRLYQDPFVWLISRGTETNGNCKLDRIVVTEALYPFIESTGVYDFKRDLSLSSDEAEDVSDHLPIWVSISREDTRSSFDRGDRKCGSFSTSSSSSGLEDWEIVLIALGVFLFLVLIAALIAFLVLKKGGGGDKYNTKVYRSENVESI